jgi:hypothetical protein
MHLVRRMSTIARKAPRVATARQMVDGVVAHGAAQLAGAGGYQVGHAFEDDPEHLEHLEPGKMRAQALVRAEPTEAEMWVR